MNVLLINPNREQMPWPVVPVGLCLVATALERAGYRPHLLDLTFSRDPARDVRSAIAAFVPDVVGLTVRNLDNCNFERPVFHLPELRDTVVREVRRQAPSATLILGGSAVNVAPRGVLDYLQADFAVVGEGEEAMAALLAALEQGRDPSAIPGVLPRAPARTALVLGLDDAPRSGRAAVAELGHSPRSEAFRWVSLAPYAAQGSPYPIQTKRGCALRCTYCVYNAIEGRSYRLRDPRDVVDEIAEAVAHGVRQVEIVDSTFNLPLHHARALCAELERRRLPVELSTMGLNPIGVTPELVAAMRRAGFTSVMCTAESASDVTLASLDKGFDRATVERAARALREGGLTTYWFFLFGAPGETLATVRETLAFCEAQIPATDMVLLSTGIRVYPGTPLAERCKQSGWFDPQDPLFEPSWYLSPELELEALYRLVARGAEAHDNWMVNAETAISPTQAWAMKRAFRVMGYKGPFWQHLPKLFRLVSRVGARQRGLRAARERLLLSPKLRLDNSLARR